MVNSNKDIRPPLMDTNMGDKRTAINNSVDTNKLRSTWMRLTVESMADISVSTFAKAPMPREASDAFSKGQIPED